MNNQKDFSDFSVTDFVWNEDFRTWTLSPDIDSDTSWNNWLKQHPEMKQVVAEAKEVINILSIKESTLSNEEVTSAIKKIIAEINRREEISTKRSLVRTIIYNRFFQVGLAASVILVVGFGLFWNKTFTFRATVNYGEVVQSSKEKLIERANTTGASETVVLNDGSKIVLEKDSKINYSTSFGQLPKRVIYLSGTASFEVAKNPAKPFLVYTNGLITKVLGTKFIIHSDNADKKVSVDVISGIVSVFSYIENKPQENRERKKINSLILTANQKANYSAEDKTLTAAIVTNPVIITTNKINFSFQNTFIDSVFRSIKEAYGIDVIFDEKSFANRTLTAQLSNETMYQKMDIICKTINAYYEVIDGKVVIYSNEAR